LPEPSSTDWKKVRFCLVFHFQKQPKVFK